MMILGGVPIKVTSPPKMEANDIGIRIKAGDRLAFSEDSMATGISNASAPTLFITEESTAATPERAAICKETLLMAGST